MNNVKRIVAAMSVIVMSAFTASAQESTGAEKNTTFGIKGGANLSSLYVNEDDLDENMKLGFQLGFFAKAGISENFAIQPELLYSQKGAQLTYNGLFDGKASFNLHYVEVPVLAVINFGKFNVHVGPYASYLAGVTIKNKGDNNSDFDFEEELDKDNFESFDYGIAGGLGLDGDGIGFGLRYNYGLKEIGKERSIGGTNYRMDAKNAVIQAYLTIGF